MICRILRKIGTDLGCDIYLFDSPRATPEISFAIRELHADSGVVLTASHNPSHDNGFKAYFNDGAQLVPPHDKAVIREVNSLTSEEYEPLPEDRRGTLHVLDSSFDRIYMDRLKTVLLRPELFNKGGAKIVYSNLHGTGGHIIVPLLKELGCNVQTVAAQDVQDGRFPTVASPNPEIRRLWPWLLNRRMLPERTSSSPRTRMRTAWEWPCAGKTERCTC